jgi:hypothetical protein
MNVPSIRKVLSIQAVKSIATSLGVLTFSLLSITQVTAQASNTDRSPYRQDDYRYNPSFSNRTSGPDFEAMEAQARLAAAQQSYAVRHAEGQTVQAAKHHSREPEELARPEAPDQSDLLKNSKDPDFIVKNFRTMWVDARQAQYFGTDQMKAALGDNKEFRKLNIHMVDDPRVADVVLKVSYTFAWDYPFELRHQNTTMVLVAGKGEGPFSGPLGAADVAREFVNAVKHARAQNKNATSKAEQPKAASMEMDKEQK